jgi:glycosyltransferase involved in cell wall biosynthesis
VDRPRVLYVINGFMRGGAELGFKTMLEHGFLQGCDVRVLAIHEGVPELRAAVEALLPPGALHVASKGKRLTLLAMAKAAWSLRELLARFRPNSVVLSLKQANILGRLLLLRHPGVHCVAFEHIAKLEQARLTPLYAFLLKRLSPRVDEVWADCSATLEGAQAYYIPRARASRIVPLFVASPEAPRKSCFDAARPIRLTTAGRLVPRKRTEVIIGAVKQLHDRGRETTLTIFGDGPKRRELEILAESLGIGGHVEFRGFVPGWHVQALEHDMFIHLSDEEGFCIVVAEAMMAGLPVIASPVGGVVEYLKDGKDGLYAPHAQPKALADLIARLIDSQPLRSELGRNAARSIEETFGPDTARGTFATLTRTLAGLRP